MKTLLTLAALLLAVPLCAAEPSYIVVNKAGAHYVIVNRVQSAPCAYCESCACPAGNCPSKCPVSVAQPGTLTTASGRTIRQTATGYVYADEDAPAQVLDCSSGKCRWADAPNSRPAYLPNVTPASYVPVSSSCPGGNCPTGFRPAPRFTFPAK